jgi:hypothetical protein
MGILLIEDGNAPDRYRIGKAFARIVLSFHAMRTHWRERTATLSK